MQGGGAYNVPYRCAPQRRNSPVSTVSICIALPGDLDSVGVLVRACLPELVLTNEAGWAHRTGGGLTWQEGLLLVAVVDDTMVGVAAAAPAVYRDHDLPVPWWVLDVVAVDGRWRGRGVGSALVRDVFDRAGAAEVTTLYGLCDEDLIGWYASMGFSVTGPGAVLDSDVEANGDGLTLGATDSECWFLSDVHTAGPRLYLPE